MEVKEVKIGDAVTFIDRRGKRRPALVTAVWKDHGELATPSVPSLNVIIVSEDPAREDSYGRQIEHETSIPHKSLQAAPGYAWEWEE